MCVCVNHCSSLTFLYLPGAFCVRLDVASADISAVVPVVVVVVASAAMLVRFNK